MPVSSFQGVPKCVLPQHTLPFIALKMAQISAILCIEIHQFIENPKFQRESNTISIYVHVLICNVKRAERRDSERNVNENEREGNDCFWIRKRIRREKQENRPRSFQIFICQIKVSETKTTLRHFGPCPVYLIALATEMMPKKNSKQIQMFQLFFVGNQWNISL